MGSQPTSFDFTDEPDGRLPGLWEPYALAHDGVGGVVWSPEPSPGTYFRAAGGLGMWQYTRAPALPVVGAPFSERGFAAGPAGVIEGRNLRASVVARQPLLLVDDKRADEFIYIVGLAVRLDPSRSRWVGAWMRATWESGSGWTTPLILEAVAADGGEPAVIGSLVPPLLPSLEDIWRNQPNAELAVELVGTEMTATISGIVELTVQVPDDNDSSQVAVLAAVFSRTGPAIIPMAAIVAAQFQSLRDLGRGHLGPPPQIPGALHLEAPDFPMLGLPVRALLAGKFIKQLRGRQFQFTQDTKVVVLHQTFFFQQGEVIRTHEKLGTQDFIPSTRDLHYQRTARSGG